MAVCSSPLIYLPVLLISLLILMLWLYSMLYYLVWKVLHPSPVLLIRSYLHSFFSASQLEAFIYSQVLPSLLFTAKFFLRFVCIHCSSSHPFLPLITPQNDFCSLHHTAKPKGLTVVFDAAIDRFILCESYPLVSLISKLLIFLKLLTSSLQLHAYLN